MTHTNPRRQFWEMVAAYFRYWNSHLHEYNFHFASSLFKLIKSYAEMIRYDEECLQNYFEQYKGTKRSDFDDLKRRHMAYAREEIGRRLEAAVGKIMASGSDYERTYRLGDVPNRHLQELFVTALHEMKITDYVIRNPDAAAPELVLKAPIFSKNELEEIDRTVREIAREQARLDALEEIEHKLNLEEEFDGDFRFVRASPTEIAKDVYSRYPDKSSAELCRLAREQYKVSDEYSGKKDQRSVGQAVHSALARIVK